MRVVDRLRKPVSPGKDLGLEREHAGKTEPLATDSSQPGRVQKA